MNLDDQMKIVIKEIDNHLSRKPDSKGMGIAEGELRDMESLLYTLKGKGIVYFPSL